MKISATMLHVTLAQNRIGLLLLESGMPLTPASPD